MPNSSLFSSVFTDDDLVSSSSILWLDDINPSYCKPENTCGRGGRCGIPGPRDFGSVCGFCKWEPPNVATLEYVITHVFFHPHHSRFRDKPANGDLALIRAILVAFHAYIHVDRDIPGLEWLCLANTLARLADSLRNGDLPHDALVPQTMGKEVIHSELSSMKPGDVLVIPLPYCQCHHMHGIIFRKKDQYTLYEPFDVKHVHQGMVSYPDLALEIPENVFSDPDFQTSLSDFLCNTTSHTKELLTGILRVVGYPVEPIPITKCVRLGGHRPGDWARSVLWHYVKVVIQLSLQRSPAGRASYKEFMLFFMQKLADHAVQTKLPSDFLHLISNKILRRLAKLGSSAPKWISDAVLHTCTHISETLHKRCLDVQTPRHFSRLFDLSQLDLTRDTQLSLRHTHEYIALSVTDRGRDPRNISLVQGLYLERTLNDFLSSEGKYFEEADENNLLNTLHSFEHEVKHGIDDWASGVINVDMACVHLQISIEQYVSSAQSLEVYKENPDHFSTLFWTTIELWTVLDKLAIKEIPMLADYSPPVPLDIFSEASLHNSTSTGVHRLCRLYRYLSARHTRAKKGWSVFSDEFTEQSLPVRYYDTCPALRDLKGCIDKQALPSDPLHAKVVIFELQCPLLFHIWRSVTCGLPWLPVSLTATPERESYPASYQGDSHNEVTITDLSAIPELQSYLVNHPRSRVHLQTVSRDPQRQKWEMLCYELSRRDMSSLYGERVLPDGPYKASDLQAYLDCTTHTSNQILSTLGRCHNDLSLPEFIAFAHLRSGGSLQWINILRELRARTLNFRHQEVYLLFALASRQPGPISDIGDLLWHQELQNSSFCHALLDELESLLDDLNAGLSDRAGLATITLLARSVASNGSINIVQRVIQLLRKLRQKTFDWVREELYNCLVSSMNGEGYLILLEMAAICRSTFAVDLAIHSAQDIEATLSSAFLIQTGFAAETEISTYLRLLLERDCRLPLDFLGVLKGAILADPSNLGIDLAVRNVWPGYRPGLCRWAPYQDDPDSYWLEGKTADTLYRPSQTIHVNLLDGSLILNGRPIGNRLPNVIVCHPMYRLLFADVGDLVVDPSDISGMDFVTRFMISKHYVHFSLRDDNLVIRAQREGDAILDLIPEGILENDLPLIFVKGYVGWLNLSTSVVEIRPLSRAWEHSPENWMIYPVSDHHYRIVKGHESLVDFRSDTWEMLSRPLECLEISKNLIVTTSPVDAVRSPSLFVALPRYGLSFFVNDDDKIESSDFKNMVCDENQSIGALVGLANKLVLCHKDCRWIEQHLNPRYILIPDFIDTDPAYPQRVTYYTYKVDVELGRLTGFSGPPSKVFLARLHAMTSRVSMSDSLTGRTGLEEAISLVWSTRVKFVTEGTNRVYDSDMHIKKLQHTKSPQLCFASARLDSNSRPRSPSCQDCMLHEASLFPSEIAKHVPTKDDACDDSRPLDTQVEDFAFTIAAAADRWSLNAPIANDISSWTEAWDDCVRVLWGAVSIYDVRNSPGKTPPSRDEELEVYALLRNGAREGEISQRFRLLLTLPTTLFARIPRFDPYYGRAPASARDSHLRFVLFRMLVAFAQQPHIYPENGPSYPEYSLSDGLHPEYGVLKDRIVNARRTNKGSGDSESDWEQHELISRLLESWPSETVSTLRLRLDPDLYDIAQLTTSLQSLFASCHRNSKLLEYLTDIFCGSCPSPRSFLTPLTLPRQVPESHRDWQITLGRLLSERPAPKLPTRDRLHWKSSAVPLSPLDGVPLHQFVSSLSRNEAPQFQREYLSHLNRSEHCLLAEGSNAGRIYKNTEKPTVKSLRDHYARCRVSYHKALDIVKETLGPKTDIERLFYRFAHWPHPTQYVLFRCLAFTSPIKLSDRWKMCIISLAHLALELQRARRLLLFLQDRFDEELFKELENELDERVAIECTDWLLMELQGDFLIRPEQVDVAKEMICPRSGKNTTILVNMGGGKSSVIIPMCAAALADGKRLVRVIVPKALEKQMLEILADRLGGFVSRPIFNLTFSRDVKNNLEHGVETVHRLVSCCMAECGIIVMRPECALSLKLACVERYLLKEDIRENPLPMVQGLGSGSLNLSINSLPKSQIANGDHVSMLFKMAEHWLQESTARWRGHGTTRRTASLETAKQDREGWTIPSALPQKPAEMVEESNLNDVGGWREALWLKLRNIIEKDTRDILDESDEILHPRSQLIYAIGRQQHVDGYPARWTITQQILRLTKKHLSSLDPLKVNFEAGPSGSFPHTRILHQDAGAQLISSIVKDVVQGHLLDLTFPLWFREPLRMFISHKDITLETEKAVENYAQKGTSRVALLLLRGLLANDILLYALMERRWRVDYGLDSSRTLLAIPYRAKDVPAEAAEFGHPDITILLTCLSYYYGGLTEEQLRLSFQILLEQDDPSSDYAIWVADCASEYVPRSLRTLSGVSLVSSEQWKRQIFPLFKRNQRVIDLYLSTVVFPKHAKEFPWKVAASSWDLAERKNHLVTGFSGTNDGQYLLPVSIAQQDPEDLRQTGSNALVLSHLLQSENASYSVTVNELGEQWTTHKFMENVVAEWPEVRVLLDVGAQILDLTNRQVAETWLDLGTQHNVAGAIYFNEKDELMVLSRNGRSQFLSSSPFSQQLDLCVTYLDHAHTKGTDIKFPHGYRAAVTLGPKVTKDHLVQGCMRMRKLGRGHSVKFLAPPDVDRAIRLIMDKRDKAVTTADILHWAIRETWVDIQRRASYWAQQGFQHKSQHRAWTEFCRNELAIEKLTDSWLQSEQKTLADLYAPGHSTETTLPMILDEEFRKRCEFLGVTSLPNSRLEEEHEREISREMEREREVEQPPKPNPADHSLHPDVTNFVRNGVIRPGSTAFRPAFTALKNNSTFTAKEASVWSPYILATEDFCKTVIEDVSLEGRMDDYMRPVQWVLSGKTYGNDVLVILSPFEADRLMPDVRLSEHVHLHPYTPRTSKIAKPSDDLMLYPIPPLPSNWNPPWHLIDQLNIFSGQLYLRDYTAYVRLSRFLGVHREELPRHATTVTRPNWSNIPGSLDLEIEEMFEDNRLRFVKMLLAIRSRGMRFEDTHMGRLLQGWLLTEGDFPSFESGQAAV